MRRYAFTLLLLLFVFGFSILAQDNSEKKGLECPTISVTPPPAAVQPGETMTFTANIDWNGVEKKKIEYKWSVDKGKIISGKGTPSITISTQGLDDTTITATVEILGLPKSCPNTVSDTGIGCRLPPKPILIDEFGNLQSGDIKARLDAFFVGLQDDSNATGYIINYGTARNIARREKFFKTYIRIRNFPANRIVFINGGREKSIRTRLWIVPAGADPSEIN